MRTDSQLRSEFRAALEDVTPAAPWLAHTVKKELGTRLSTRRVVRAPVQLRLGLNVVAILVLIGLAVAAVGVFVTFHQVVPASPASGRIFYPTKMVTASTGWSWVEPSELWRTTDGGAHWTKVAAPSVPDRPGPYTETPYLLDATHAWIAESGQGAAGSQGPYIITTFSTVDGGKTWHQGASIPGVSPKLFFIDQSHGWLLLPPQGSSATDYTATLYTTDDAGLHWNIKSNATLPVGIDSLIFSSLTTGWIAGTGGTLLVTHDGGVTWQIQPLPVTPTAVSTINLQFFDAQHGIATWSSSSESSLTAPPVELLVTSDGGTTWDVRPIPGEFPLQLGGNFVDANHGWVIAGTAADFNAVPAVSLPLYRTDDGGLTWVRVPTNVIWRSRADRVGPIDIVRFVDQNNGFAVREKDQANGYVQWLKTTDGGRTWTVVVEAPKTLA